MVAVSDRSTVGENPRRRVLPLERAFRSLAGTSPTTS